MEEPLNNVNVNVNIDDDLFGDTTGLDLAMDPSTGVSNLLPPTRKGLAEKVDALKISGCTRRIAWSKQGLLAFISRDGTAVFIHALQCDKKTGQWHLSSEVAMCPMVIRDNHPIVHLEFNDAGINLALLDAGGGTSIYFCRNATMTQWVDAASIPPDQESETAQPVGFAWLATDKVVVGFEKGVRGVVDGQSQNESEKMKGGRWKYSPQKQGPMGIVQARARIDACMCITQLGYIKLFFQQLSGHWDNTSIELVKTMYTDGILTHACIAPAEGNGALIVTHSIRGKVNIYRLHITWSTEAPTQITPPPQFPLLKPNFHITHIKSHHISNIFYPPSPHSHHPTSTDDTTTTTTSTSTPPPPQQPTSCVAYDLTHLHLLSTLSEGKFANAYLFAVFSAAQHNAGPLGDRKPCVLTRWKLVTETEALHPGFDDVIYREAEAPPQPMMNLRRAEDIYFDAHILDVERDVAGNAITLLFDDGTFKTYDIKSFTPVNEDIDPLEVTSLANAGFYFPVTPEFPPVLHVAYSPSGCVAVGIDAETDVKMVYMMHDALKGLKDGEDGMGEGEVDEEQISRAIAGMALAFARDSGANHSADDLIALTTRLLNPTRRLQLLREVYHALPIFAELHDERHGQILNNQFVPKCLGLQAALGFKSLYQPRELSASIAWLALTLRQITIIFSVVFKWFNYKKDVEFYEEKILIVVEGNVRLMMGMLKYVMNELFSLSDSLLALKGDDQAMIEKVKTIKSPSLCLILCFMTRKFLKYMSISVITFATGFSNVQGLNIARFQICDRISALANDAALPLPRVRDLMNELDLLTTTTTPEAQQTIIAAEHEMFINGTVPPSFYKLTIKVLTEILPRLFPHDLPELDRLALATADYACLGIVPDARTAEFRKKWDIDLLRREMLEIAIRPQSQRIRRCSRCCEISDDPAGPKSGALNRLWVQLQFHRTCTCGGIFLGEVGERFYEGVPQRIFRK